MGDVGAPVRAASRRAAASRAWRTADGTPAFSSTSSAAAADWSSRAVGRDDGSAVGAVVDLPVDSGAGLPGAVPPASAAGRVRVSTARASVPAGSTTA